MDPLALCCAAATAAWRRLANATGEAEAFGAASEASYWFVVISDDLRVSPLTPLQQAVRFGRHAVTHGGVAFTPRDRDVYQDTYTDRYGAWCWPPEPATWPGETKATKKLRPHYQAIIGMPIVDTLRDAFDGLTPWLNHRGLAPIL